MSDSDHIRFKNIDFLEEVKQIALVFLTDALYRGRSQVKDRLYCLARIFDCELLCVNSFLYLCRKTGGALDGTNI